METVTASTGTMVSYSVAGSGPPLVLVHGSFSDHETNWTFVAPLLQRRCSVYAIARRGRGATDATHDHTLEFAFAFFANTLHVPTRELDALRASELWRPIVADARASLADLRSIRAYRFDAARFSGLGLPVLLQIGSDSPRDLYATDALAAALRDVRIDTLAGQAHEGMTAAPELYAQATMRFLRPPSSCAVA